MIWVTVMWWTAPALGIETCHDGSVECNLQRSHPPWIRLPPSSLISQRRVLRPIARLHPDSGDSAFNYIFIRILTVVLCHLPTPAPPMHCPLSMSFIALTTTRPGGCCPSASRASTAPPKYLPTIICKMARRAGPVHLNRSPGFISEVSAIG